MYRINENLKYTTEHDGGFGVKVSVVWNVPWTARIQWRDTGPEIEDIEHSGLPLVVEVRVHFPGLVYPLNDNTTVNESLKSVWSKVCMKDYMLADIDQQILKQIQTINEQRGQPE